jgi:tubulin polyglutamylase TTLL2
MWVKIETIIILTVINLASTVPDLNCCFELLGFDVMIDSNLKPWLIEVNSSPAMSMDNNIDYQVKPDLIRDIISLLNIESYDTYLVSKALTVIFTYANIGLIKEKLNN